MQSDKEQKIDSIFYLINIEGRNQNLPTTSRRRALEKASTKMQEINDDSLLTKYYSRLSLAYLRLPDSALFRENNHKTMEFSRIAKDTIVHAEVHWDLAQFHRDHGVQDSAYYNFNEALKLYQSLGNNLYAGRMLNNMASVQLDIKDYTGSEINTIKAIELLKPLKAYERLFYCYNNLGSVSLKINEYNEALKYFNEALNYLNKTDKKHVFFATVNNNISQAYQEMEEHEKALEGFNKVLRIDSLQYKNPKEYALVLNNLGYSKFKINDTTELPELFLSAIKIQDSLEYIWDASISYSSLAEYYLHQEDSISAIHASLKAKSKAILSANNDELLKTLRLLPNIDPKNAVKYVNEYITLNDSLQYEERKIRNKFTRIRFETNEFIEQNELLDKQRQLWLGIAIISFLLGALLFIIISQRIKTQKLQFQQNQQKSNEEIFNLMLTQQGKLEEGKHIEQKRISEELHDGILGQMLGIRLILSGLNKKKDDKAIIQREELIKKLQLIEEEIRGISHELNYNSHDKVNNFILSLQDLLNTIGESANLSHNFTYNEDLDWDQLLGDVKINIYRIVQESLQNCVKHAQAKNINVNFDTEDGNIIITIIDNGKGFITKKRRNGIGLKNISSRIKKLNGSYSIKSKIGKGTTVTLIIPIDGSMI